MNTYPYTKDTILSEFFGPFIQVGKPPKAEKNEYTFTVPGFNKTHFSAKVDGDTLSITCAKDGQVISENSFKLVIPKDADISETKISVVDGVLRVKFKKKPSKSLEIKID